MSVTSNETQKQTGLRKKELIIASLKVFCEKGYEAATVDDIVNKAHCSHGLFYHYFKNKNEILEESVKEKITEVKNDLFEKLKKTESYKIKLKIITEKLFEDLKKDEKYSYYIHFLIMQSFNFKNKPVKPLSHSTHNEKPIIFLLEDFFKAGQINGEFNSKYSAFDCSNYYLSIIKGTLIGYIIAPNEIQKKIKLPNVNFILDTFCRGE